MRIHKQGAALITALFIMALIAAASIAMLMQQRIAVHQAEEVMNYNRSYFMAQTISAWARDVLLLDLKNTSSPIDFFPRLYPKTTVPGGYFIGDITDAEGQFNLNNLSIGANQASFTNMLHTLLPAVSHPELITASIAYWVSPNKEPGIEQAYVKAKLNLPTHQLMVNVSELRQVIGVTQAIYLALEPYVTALPAVNTPLNINTADPVTLLTLQNNLTLDNTRKMASLRPYVSETSFFTLNNMNSHPSITIQSQYFFSHALVKLGRQTLLLNSLLFRTTDSGKPIVVTLWQSES